MEKTIIELSCQSLLVDVSEYPLNFLIFPHKLAANACKVIGIDLEAEVTKKHGKNLLRTSFTGEKENRVSRKLLHWCLL